MLPSKVVSYIDKLDAKVKVIDKTLCVMRDHDEYFKIANICSHNLIIETSSLIEIGTKEIIISFCSNKSSTQIQKYLFQKLNNEHVSNVKSIKCLLERFNPDWAEQFLCKMNKNDEQKVAINSIRAIRNSVAHGGSNVIGIVRVKNYYNHSKRTVNILAEIILG